jgi:Tfp pilus assembly PilM family ATPase
MAWGLEIEPERLRLCAAEAGRGRVRILRCGEATLPVGLVRPSLTEPNLTDPAALGRLLGDLCRRLKCRGWVRAALPDAAFSLRGLLTDELPASRDEALRFLRWQARTLLPFPPDEARLDFLPPIPGPDGRRRITCLMGRNSVLTEYEQLLTGAGLQAARLDARSVALAQAASPGVGARPAGLVVLGPDRMTLLLLEAGRPHFLRTLATPAPLAPAARERVVREVADSLVFARESEGIPSPEELLLEGPEPGTAELTAALRDWLELPVRPLDHQSLGLAAGNGGPVDVLHWGAAIGAAIGPC